MRICPNCSHELTKNIKLKMDNTLFANLVAVSNRKSYKIKAFVCPNCGKIEMYIERNEI